MAYGIYGSEYKGAYGGRGSYYVNKTGATSVEGTIVAADDTADNAVKIAAIDSEKPFGVVAVSGVAADGWVPIITTGKCRVLLENAVSSTHGNWCRTGSSTAGRCDASAAAPPGPVAQHGQETGKSLETVTGGTDELMLTDLHFN